MNQVIRLIPLTLVGWAIIFSQQAQAKIKKKAAAPSAAHVRSGGAARPLTHKAGRKETGTKAVRGSHKMTRVSGKAVKGGRRGRHVQAAVAAAPAATWRRGQMEPTPDRYREIQQALASKGYLKSEPTGSWDAASQDALKRFQGDQKLDQSGAITAKSLTALGLGPAPPPQQ